MIQAIISLFGIVRGLFVAGGLVARFFTWLNGSFAWIVTGFIGLGTLIKNLFLGTWSAIKKISIYIAAFHIVEMARKLVFITFIVSVLGFVINYAVTNLIIYDGKALSTLFNSLINEIASFGAVGHNLLALLSKLGIFDNISIIATVMLYTLIARISLHILFK